MSFAGAGVLSFESRRATEIAELIRINGGDPFVAPALVEAPIERNTQAFEFADRLYAGEFNMLILLTGVGTRYLANLLATRDPEERFHEALRRLVLVSRGPKPSTVLREWGLVPTVLVPEPNTWREVLSAVRDRSEQSVAVQEYGRSNVELTRGLAEQGRTVTAVPVYQWQLPPDTTPLAESLDGLEHGKFQVAVFTTGVQIDHLIEFSGRMNRAEGALKALRKIFIASVGPDTTEALRSHGIEPAFTPSHPKMGVLIQEAAKAYSRMP